MRPTYPPEVEAGRDRTDARFGSSPGEPCGLFVLRHPDWPECGFAPPRWEHVSARVAGQGARCPTWEEMAWVKGLFFLPEEWVVQFHPADSDHINVHPHVLHLWRAVGVEFPTPPKECV
jgi:hypothetical protein